ncbi:MAG: PepSY domain-containing protein [Allosphingosinicella sp.]|uniref:PepSY domain-containing protein n=1 Tax=Allosphingosinicella sp. TaxID=2823234 RepID=UPI0039474156
MASKSSRRGVLRRLHRVLGLFVALYVLMASATGAMLMFRHELIGLASPEARTGPGGSHYACRPARGETRRWVTGPHHAPVSGCRSWDAVRNS